MNPKEYSLIAVVGVSNDASKFGHRIFRDLLKAGYPAEGVNPKGGFVLGRHIHKSLAEMEKKPDLVITVVHPAVTEKVVEECNRLGIKAVWMQPGSESGAATEKAKEYGIKAATACFMVVKGVW
ncbi:MAG: CoA-binding domain protein [Elusimicrobia bacterium]|nr:MAG: CoA-binding domain protein [Elusimicrobiota bacterium]KAF0154094.1 MAG: CoA-binding domain protein [Elusimicrobiota bacterium]